jgi:hypothetical protein
MASEKVTVRLDANMVERMRAELGVADESDAAMIERALNAYLLERLMDASQAGAQLAEADAERLAYEELHAARAERQPIE